MKFIDAIQIRVRSGRGGAGMVSFRSAKNAPKLGADGGDGGFGGPVVLKANAQMNTLSHLYHNRLYRAEDGQKGGSNGRTGRNGVPCIIEVPVGTVAVDVADDACLGELLSDGDELLIAEGGKRGLGNLRYLSSRHQAPEEHTKGGPSIELELKLELKLIADIGLAGFPNAGKSTLLSTISAAKPKVADYPFTTLEPQLGVVDLKPVTGVWGQSMVVADIPGLISGASEGRGLGLEFLRHLERTQVLLYLIDPHNLDGLEPYESFEILQREIQNFGRGLAAKPFLVALSKCDLAEDDDELALYREAFEERGIEVWDISSVGQKGLRGLLQRLWQLVQEGRQQVAVEKAQGNGEQETWRQAWREAEDQFETLVSAGDDQGLLGG